MRGIEKQAEIERVLRDIAKDIEEQINIHLPSMGFALLVFDFYDTKIGNYISNAERANMIEALRETADRLEKNQDIPPASTTIQ